MNYRDKAIHCVKDTILPMQREQFEECGRCLDEQYKRYGNTNWLPGVCLSGGSKRKSKRRITLRMFTPKRIVYYREFVAR